MKLKKYLYLLCLGALCSCTDMDIPPKNILNEKDIFGNTNGVMSYISRMYSTLPMEDFRYYYPASGLFHSNDQKYCQQSCLTGEAIGRDTKGAEIESASYWDGAYACIRDVNTFLETLPKYASAHTEAAMKTYVGEAYFVRAFVYYSLVKRYGGVPILDKVVDYPNTVGFEATKLYRDSEEATWDFIASDLDLAYTNLPASNQKGRLTRYAAAAFKSRVMLHAGSISKYNTVTETYNSVRICGIPAERATGYFKAAYDASKLVEGSSHKLYKGKWVANNKQAQTENFSAIFTTNTEETIFARYYKDPESVHNFDDSAQPMQTSTGGNNSELCPTLDFVELFEGFDKDANGQLANFDDAGNYKLYASPTDAFANCEPRLRATVILPMDQFKEQSIDLRRGIWTGSATSGIKALLPKDYVGNYNSKYNDASDLKLSNSFTFNSNEKNLITLKNGTKMARSGASGIVSEWDFGNISGFYLRKYLNPTPGTDNNGNKSSQTWIEIRYAEVLLNRAEAAYELVLAGESVSTSGDNYLDEAFRCINLIRERAGATQLNNSGDLNSIDIVRNERRKELAFEHKTYWDLKRWRVLYDEQNGRRYRTLNAFYSTDAEKYFLDIKSQEPRAGIDYIYKYDTRNYYQQIPNVEITRNENCKQNPGY